MRSTAKKHAPGPEVTAPSTGEIVGLGAPVALRDGLCVRLRQIRPTDEPLLRRGFERLSSESRYRRFLMPMDSLSKRMTRYLTEVDHHDHEAIVALDEETGEGIGVARYVRSKDRPEVAELAVTVLNGYQQKGLGTLLVCVLAGRAREEGITTFSALMLASNHEMLELLQTLGPVRIVDHESGTVEVEMPIPEVGFSPAVRKLLQVAARTAVSERPAAKTRLSPKRR
ncbi:MAG: N-acetyltransferase family protein [Thermoleophilaceae bacterium]